LELNLLQIVAVYALPVIFAFTLHEAAHGYVAKHFGGLTAERQGRVTLNTLKHIDPDRDLVKLTGLA
jgi:Zn-dependent protease